MIVDVGEIERLLARMAEINRVPLEEIQWTRDGEPISIPKEWIEDWRFVGMTNVSFIEAGAYSTGLQDVSEPSPDPHK